MSDEAGMNKTVLAKSTAVDVIVVKPRMGHLREYSRRNVAKRRTIGEQEPRGQVLEGVPQFLDFLPTKHFP